MCWVNHSGEILMIRRSDNDKWALPGGAMDIGESMPDAASGSPIILPPKAFTLADNRATTASRAAFTGTPTGQRLGRFDADEPEKVGHLVVEADADLGDLRDSS